MFTDEMISTCKRIEEKRPLIHCITNVITINDCANVLLALGASPIMAHHPKEVAEIAAKASALVLNMGATESFDAMINAGLSAKENDVAVILDPVGAASSAFRREMTLDIINKVHPDVIRGNLSEINALIRAYAKSANRDDEVCPSYEKTGVDAIDTESLDLDSVNALSKEIGAIIIVSGPTDYIVKADTIESITGGSALLRKITGSGCMLSALLGAFYSLDKSLDNIISCIKLVDECASLAEKKTVNDHAGTMTFKMHFIDIISCILK